MSDLRQTNESDSPRPAERRNSPAPEAFKSPHDERARILIIDDFAFDREYLAGVIRDSGHDVILAETGEQGLEVLGAQDVDLILLDSQLPGLDGPEVLSIIRQKYSRLEVPIVMVTGMGHTEFVVKCLEKGANDFVTKPIDDEILAARVETQLSLLNLRGALQTEQEFNTSLIASAHDMIFAAGMEGQITLFNRTAEENFGWKSEDVIGEPISVLFESPDKADEVIDHANNNGVYVGELQAKRKSGESFEVRLSITVHRDKTGQSLGIVGIAMDLSELRRLERERAELLKTKENFVAIASHDLKNPVGTILGYAWMLEGDAQPGATVDEGTIEALRQIRMNADVMKKLIENFLNFHALEEGGLQLDRAEIRIEDLANEVVSMSQWHADEKSIELVLKSPKQKLPLVKADRDKITQVIRNLIDNAIKFCPEGCKVEVRMGKKKDAVEVRVIDNGPGLTEEDMGRVFRKFERLSSRPTAGEKSSGMGLSICKQLIEMHGGEIGVENNKSSGATFWFRLKAEA